MWKRASGIIVNVMATAITIAIMAGGESRRMGRDKALLPAMHGSLLEQTAREAQQTGLPVVVVGRNRPEDWHTPSVAFAADLYPKSGPLGGIASALRFAGTDVLALACDLPFLRCVQIEWLLKQAETDTAGDGLVVENHGQLEPLFALYRHYLLDAITTRLESGLRSLQGLILDSDFQRITADAEIARALTNVNTPDDWAAATRQLQTGSDI